MEDRFRQDPLASVTLALSPLRSSAAICVAVLITACSSLVGETPVETGSTSQPSRSTQTTSRDCTPDPPGAEGIDTGSSATDALFLSGELFHCSDDIVVVDNSLLNDLAVAAQLAAALEAPLFFPEPRLAAEIGRLKPRRVHLVGTVDLTTPPSAETLRHDLASASEAVKAALGVSVETPIPAIPDASTIVQTVRAIVDRDAVAVPQPSPPSTTVPAAPTDIVVADVVTGIARPTSAQSIWIVDGRDPVSVLFAAALGRSADASVVAVDGSDILGITAVAEAIAGRTTSELRFIGPRPDASDWELSVLTNAVQVPGGGFRILPEDGKRRYVGFYGHPGTAALGALGEQGPLQTLERLQPFLDEYRGDGSQTVPTFEMIASVASAGATDDGDYSFEWPIDTFAKWIDIARDNDIYVILDLQPGRDDFLTQAMFYEDLLVLPFVGLALDPEWRLAPDQVHLQQVGSVDAAEVNQVIEWLGNLVRDNGLPQKMMIVHQFRTSMVRNRELLQQRPELQMVIQMDGDGTEAQKNSTYETLKAGAEDAFWSWGWKNFFDEDEPGPPTPESTMGKEPSPVYVSYQ